MTNYPRELAEKALGHALRDKVEAAYQRGDLFEKRRKLMDSWADYCLKEQTEADVVPINCTSSAHMGPLDRFSKRHFSAGCFSSLSCQFQVLYLSLH
jgi:hypothetical protein